MIQYKFHESEMNPVKIGCQMKYNTCSDLFIAQRKPCMINKLPQLNLHNFLELH